MIILTTFLTIGFVTASIALCWFTDKYSETLDDLERYKHQVEFLQNQNKELREVYKKCFTITQKGNSEKPKSSLKN